MPSLTVQYKSGGAQGTSSRVLDFLEERISVAELIRGYIYQEVTEFNARWVRTGGVVELTEAERLLNGPRRRSGHRVDWEGQYERAITAFQQSRLIILIGDRQVTGLDEEIELRASAAVTFLRLVPLAGG